MAATLTAEAPLTMSPTVGYRAMRGVPAHKPGREREAAGVVGSRPVRSRRHVDTTDTSAIDGVPSPS